MMAFSNEVIPEEQKDKFSFSVQSSNSGRQPTLHKWVIDHDNEFYLVKAGSKGGTYSGTMEENIFYFHAYGEDVFIKAIPCGHSHTQDKKIIFQWKIIELSIPSGLQANEETLEGLIVQAFKVWGRLANGHSYDQVDVQVACEVSIG